MDDFGRQTWVHMLKYKSNALTLLKNFIAYVKLNFIKF